MLLDNLTYTNVNKLKVKITIKNDWDLIHLKRSYIYVVSFCA